MQNLNEPYPNEKAESDKNESAISKREKKLESAKQELERLKTKKNESKDSEIVNLNE